MRLGLLTAPFPDRDLMAVADWAAGEGFECLEIACWPREGAEARRYAGTSHIDVADLSEAQAQEIVAALRERGLTVSGSATTRTRSTPTRRTGSGSSAT